MTDDTREKSDREGRRRVPSLDRRQGQRLSAGASERRQGAPTPFSHALLRARLALLRPRPVSLESAAEEK